MRMLCISVVLLSALATPRLGGQAQTAVQRYREAQKVFQAHSDGDFLHDDSTTAVNALADMWAASAQAAVQVLSARPDAPAKDIGTALCGLVSSSGDCGLKDGARESVLSLAPRLFLVSQFSGEAGTVFVVGFREGRPALVWSINSAMPQQADPHNLVTAWRADRAGGACREQNSGHPAGTCGPLWADIGLLPPDANGRPRFYVDAGYAQIMGATIAKQTSVWDWEGDAAHLLWIDLYGFMIDQRIGTQFTNGVFSIGEKDEFRSFYACGSCEARQIVRHLRITPAAVVNLGKTSTTPELDLVDELFWRLANNRPTGDIASAQVAELLRPQILAARIDSRKIDPSFFTTGMLGDVSVTHAGSQEHLCFTVDGDIGRLYFTLQTSPGAQTRLVDVTQPSGEFGDCPKQSSEMSKH